MSGLGAGESEMERQASMAVDEVHDEMLAALGVLGRRLERRDQVGFRARLPEFMKMDFATLEPSLDDASDDEYRYTLLSLAAETGQSEALAALLAAGADPRAVCDRAAKPNAAINGATALHWAAKWDGHGARECLLLLVEAGADVDALDPGGMAPLAWAASRGALGNMAALLDAGARLGDPKEDPVSAWAAAAQRPESLAFLRAWSEAASLRDEVAGGTGEPAKSPRL